MTQIVADRRPALARFVVTALATLLAFAFSVAAFAIARLLGWDALARGIVLILPASAAYIATALTQHLMRGGR